MAGVFDDLPDVEGSAPAPAGAPKATGAFDDLPDAPVVAAPKPAPVKPAPSGGAFADVADSPQSALVLDPNRVGPADQRLKDDITALNGPPPAKPTVFPDMAIDPSSGMPITTVTEQGPKLVQGIQKVLGGTQLPDPRKPQDTPWQVFKKTMGVVAGGAQKTVGGALTSIANITPEPAIAAAMGSQERDALADGGPQIQVTAGPGKTKPISMLQAAKANSPLARFGKKLAAKAEAHIQENIPNVPGASFSGVASDVVAGIANMAPGMAASYLTKSPAPLLATIGVQSYGQRYADSIAQGRTPKQADTDATFAAAAEALPELLPLHVLMKPGQKFLGKAFTMAYTNGAQEVLTEALNQGYAVGALKEDMTWGQAVSAMAKSGIIGSIIGPIMAGGAHGIDAAQAKLARQDIDPAAVDAYIATRQQQIAGQPAVGVPPVKIAGQPPIKVQQGKKPTVPTDVENPPVQPQQVIDDAGKNQPQNIIGNMPALEPVHDPVTNTQIGWETETGEVIALDDPRAKAPEKSFTTTPGAIAAEHAAEVSAIEAQGTRDADPQVQAAREALKTNIDPATGARPKGAKALREFRGRMQDIIAGNGESRHTVKPNVSQTDTESVRPVPEAEASKATVLPGTQKRVSQDAPQSGPRPAGAGPRAPDSSILEGQREAGAGTVPDLRRAGSADAPSKLSGTDQSDVALRKLPSALPQGDKAGGQTGSPDSGRGGIQRVVQPQGDGTSGVATGKTGKVRGAPRKIEKDADHAAAILARSGGIRNDEAHDLVKGRGLQQMIPGVGPLIRPKGVSIDRAGEILWNAGFWGNPDSTPRPTENEVLQLLEKTRRGADNKPTKVYAAERAAELEAERLGKKAEEDNAQARADIEKYAKSFGHTLADGDHDTIMGAMGEHGIDAETAVAEHMERQALASHEELKQYARDEIDDIPFDQDDAPQAVQPPEDGGRAGARGEPPEGAAGGEGPRAEVGKGDARLAPAQDGAEGVIFKTAKGSTYRTHADGTTTRDKAARPEHPGEEGPQPRSQRTFYVTKEHADQLGLFQTQGGPKMAVEQRADGTAGVKYLDGKDAGKFEKRTVAKVETAPAKGLIPVETWKNGTKVHFGNEITEVGDAPLKTEKGADGKDQTIIPGGEASARQAAKAREDAGKGKLKAKAPQQDAGGMFEDKSQQTRDMFDQPEPTKKLKYDPAELATAVEDYREMRRTDERLSKRASELEDESRALVKTGPTDKHAEVNAKARAARKESNDHFDKIVETAQAWSKKGVDLDAEIAKPRAAKPAEKTPDAKKPGAIEDFGEKLEGARKHYAEAYAEKMKDAADVDVAAEPLSKSWPEPDYEKLIEGGADPWMVSFVRAMREEVPTKPQKSWKLKGWVDQVNLLRKVSGMLINGEFTKAQIKEKIKGDEFARLRREIEGRADLYEAVGHKRSLKGISVYAGSYSVFNGVRHNPPKTIWSVQRERKATAFGNMPSMISHADTREAAIADFKKKIDDLPDEESQAKETRFDLYARSRAEGKEYFIGKKVGAKVIELKPFADPKEARKYMAENRDELIRILEKKKFIPSERKENNSPRVGVDHRNGADVTPEQFGDTFGFRGVQFGNYVEGPRRQADLNEAYDALLDMAGILNIPPRSISLGGKLGLAFGARGKGGLRPAKAHYEPGQIVINLTKESGAGSLAHEWWHALDNYFSRNRGEKGGYVTESPVDRGDGVRTQMIGAFKKVADTIRSTAIQKRSQILDNRRSSPYWSTGREMSARAFESYVIEKLRDQSGSNDYLANIVSEDYWKAAEGLGLEGDGKNASYPYPTAAEVPAVREAFDNFFKTVESKDEGDNKILYSQDRGETGPVNPQRAALEAGRRNVAERGVRRGADALISRLHMDLNLNRRRTNLDRAQIREVEDFMRFIGDHMFDGVGLRIRADRGPMGQFDIATHIVTMFRKGMESGEMDRTMVHELWHYLDQGMTAADRRAITAEFQRQRQKWLMKNPWAERFIDSQGELQNTIRGSERVNKFKELHGDEDTPVEIGTDAEGRPVASFPWTTENYRFLNRDEYFAETMADKYFDYRDLQDQKVSSILGWGRDIWQRMVSGVKRVFGRDASGRIFQGYERGEMVAPMRFPGRVDDDRARGILEQRRGGEPIFDKLAGDPPRNISEEMSDRSASLLERLKTAASPEAIQESVDRWRTGLQDRFLPLLRVQQAIEKQFGRRLTEAENPYLAEELSAGRRGAKLEDLDNNHVRPLMEALHATGISQAELEAYLYARHAPERNARISKINPDFAADMLDPEGTGSGMTNDEAAAIMDAAKASGKIDKLEGLAKQVDAILDLAMKERVDGGLLSQTDADRWRGVYKHYVPLRGDPLADPELGEDRPRTGSGINVRGKESQMAFGRRSKARDILAYTVMQAEEAIVRAEKNRVAKSFYDLARLVKNDDFWKVDKVDVRKVFNKESGTVEKQATTKISAEDKDYTVSAKINGVEHRVTMNRGNPAARRLAESMRSLNEEQLNMVVRTFGAINRFLSTVNTSLNPEFVISNAFRDLQTATFNLPQHQTKGLVKGVLRDYLPALKASMQDAFGGGKGDWKKWAEEFRANGGRVFFNNMEDLAGQRVKLERAFKDAKPGITSRKAITAIFDTVEKVNKGVENGIRLAAYKNAREAGMTPARAASLAKNLTVNFNRRGSYGSLINSMYLFYNAGVQGTTTMLTAMKSPTVRRALYGAVAAGAALELMNSMVSDDDDDGQMIYDKISDFDKSRNLIIMDPTSDKGRFFKIPLPYGYNSFFNIGRAGVEIYRGKPVSDVAANLVTSITDSFNPLGTGSILNLIAPTIADPVVDLVRNRDFADKPIMPDQRQFGPKTPENQRYWNSVSPISKEITDFLNRATGGDDVQPGGIDVSPEILEYMFGQVTGAAGAFFLRNADLFGKIVDPASSLDWNDIPMARKVVGSNPKWFDRSAFYQRVEEIEQAGSYLKDYYERGDVLGAQKYQDQHKALLGLKKAATKSRQALSKINKAKASAKLEYDLRQMPRATYDAKVKQYEEAADKIITDFNKAFIQRGLVPSQPQKGQKQSALDHDGLKAAIESGDLTQFAESGQTWTREDAIKAARAAGMPATAAALRDIPGPIRAKPSQKSVGESAFG